MSGRCPLSIIITIYNDAEALTEFLSRILAQKAKDFEVVVVNNGSSDSTVDVCENYRKADPRVIVVHMDLGTPAEAYNNGLQAATGRYVHFANPADSIADGALENISPILRHNLDVIFLESPHPSFWDINHASVLRRLCTSLPDKLWDKLIRRELLTKYDITFSKGIVWEEVDFCINLYLHATSYNSIDFPYYQQGPKETLSRDPDAVFSRGVLTLSKWAGPAESTFEEYSTIIHSWMVAIYCDILLPTYSQLPKEARNLYRAGMGDFKWLLLDNRKNQMLKILYIVCGPYITSLLIQYENRYVPSAKATGVFQFVHKKVNLITAYCRTRIGR